MKPGDMQGTWELEAEPTQAELIAKEAIGIREAAREQAATNLAALVAFGEATPEELEEAAAEVARLEALPPLTQKDVEVLLDVSGEKSGDGGESE